MRGVRLMIVNLDCVFQIRLCGNHLPVQSQAAYPKDHVDSVMDENSAGFLWVKSFASIDLFQILVCLFLLFHFLCFFEHAYSFWLTFLLLQSSSSSLFSDIITLVRVCQGLMGSSFKGPILSLNSWKTIIFKICLIPVICVQIIHKGIFKLA